jgi:hypothetical protein
MKKCSVCKKLRKSSSFHKSSRNNDGLDYWCKFCKKIRNKIYNSTHKEKIAKRTKKYYLLHKEETLKQCKKYASEHKKEIKQRQHRWYKRNKKQHSRCNKQYYLKHKKRLLKLSRKQRLKSLNLSINDYNLMIQEQNGVCAICKQTETLKKTNGTHARRLSVDHDHKSGKVRGLLCNRCNIILGKIEDNTFLLNTMIKYLQNNRR